MTGASIERISIYFAHPRTTFNTPREREALQAIKNKFQNASIINPASYPETDNMWFFRKLVQQTKITVFMTTEDGFIGKGVFTEIEYAQFINRDVFFYNIMDQKFYSSFEIIDINEDDWRNYARVRILSGEVTGEISTE